MTDFSLPHAENPKKVLDYLGDGILIINDQKVIVYCNKALSQLYNLSQTEIFGKTSCQLVDAGHIDHSFSDLAFSTKKTITYAQATKQDKLLISTDIPILDTQGNVSFILEQVRSLAALEFYAPDSISPQLPPSIPGEHSNNKHQETPILAEFKSAAMQSIYKLADSMAPKNINILILGASGTGKSQLAKRIHENSARKSGPFVTINCAAIPDSLIESELFGYLKGAFSGASNHGKIGLLETAKGGTLFLDEIGELPLSLQSKLLQFIQEKTYIPIGGVHPIHVDTRIIAATNQDIPTLISQGRFREDLYYRLSTMSLLLPPLKNRSEDIRLLLNYFCNEFSLKHQVSVSFATNTINILCSYSWPGNIREMEHLVEFLILSCQSDYITPDMLPSNIYSEGMIGTEKTAASNTSAAESKAISVVDAEQATQDAGTSHTEVPYCKDAPPEALCNTVFDYDQVETLQSFIDLQEGALVHALYPKFHTSYLLSKRLQISQSTASRLIRKYISRNNL